MADAMWRGVADADPRRTARLARLVLLRSEVSTERSRAHAALGLLMLRAGRGTEARGHLDRALAAGPDDAAERLRLQAWAARAAALDGAPGHATAGAREVLEVSSARGDHVATCEALNVLTLVDLCEGHVRSALQRAREAVALSESAAASVPRREMLNHLHLGLALVEADRLDQARAAFTKGHEDGEAGGPAGLHHLHRAFRSVVGFLAGSWDDAVADARAGLAAADGDSAAWLPLGLWSMIESSRLHDESARQLLARAASEPAGAPPPFGAAWPALGRSGESQDTAEAHEVLLEGWLASRGTPYLLTWRLLDPLLLRCALEVGDEPLVESLLVEAAAGAARAPDVPSARGAWLRVRALAHDDADAARAAVEAYRSSGRLISLAQTCLEAARILGSRGERSEAVELVAEAMRIFHQLGARRWTERAGRLHLQLVEGAGLSEERPQPAGWEELTPAQARVARLAADGLTTAQIAEQLVITQHTVNSHMKSVYAKLNVSSRAQLAALFVPRTVWSDSLVP